MTKIDVNAPATLTFSLLCLLVYGLSLVAPNLILSLFVLYPDFSFTNPISYFTTVSYVFGHSSTSHLIGNLSFILLLGPVLGEKYGSRILLFMMLITTIFTAMLFYFFFSDGLLGASGIVFMFIILISFANKKKDRIPLTFILVLIIFLGKEIAQSFEADQISQTAHLAGGLCGSIFGFYLYK